MSEPDVTALVGLRMRQASEALDDARTLLSQGRGTRTAVNRAYYAAFYALLAVLQTAGQIPRKHSGAITLFDQEFVKPDCLPLECSTLIHSLFEMRLQDDYQRLEPVTMEEALKALAMADRFAAHVRAYLTDKGCLLD